VVLGEDLLVEEAALECEARDWPRCCDVDEFALLVAADIVVANEGALVDEHAELQTALRQALLVGVIADPHHFLLDEVHLSDLFLFIVDEANILEPEGHESHVIEEPRLAVPVEEEAVEHIIVQVREDYLFR